MLTVTLKENIVLCKFAISNITLRIAPTQLFCLWEYGLYIVLHIDCLSNGMLPSRPSFGIMLRMYIIVLLMGQEVFNHVRLSSNRSVIPFDI